MEAIVFHRHGGPEVLELTEVTDPSPKEDEVLVNVEAIGVNYRDVNERNGTGRGAPPPAISGVEGAGRLATTGARVAWMTVAGSYAEKVAAPLDALLPVPAGVPLEVAAAALVQGMTAHYLVFDAYPVQPGDWVLVHAAAGGVGLSLVQLAKLAGGRVIGTTSSEEKAELARQAGADHVIGYDGFADHVRALTGSQGVGVVYDGVGKATFLEGLQALRPTGTLILYGAASGHPDPLDVTLLASAGSLCLQRPTLRTYVRTPEMLRGRSRQLFELIESGNLKIHIGGRYPLATACSAHHALERRKTTGKLLLVP